MFSEKDVSTLTITGIIDKKGEILPISFKMPLVNENIDIPSNVLTAELSEFHLENDKVTVYSSSKICIGKIYSSKELVKEDFYARSSLKNIFVDLDTKVIAYKNSENKVIAYKVLDENDIVVENLEEFKNTIINISREYSKVTEGISRIKKMHN